MTKTIAKTIRVTAEQWDRIEQVATNRKLSANQFLVDLAMEALDRREWPSTDAEIHVARATMFVAWVLERDLISAGREDEVEEIRRFISTLLPEPDSEPRLARPSETRKRGTLASEPGVIGREQAGQIERIYRGVYLLSTLKRDEMLREGRKDELERIHKDAYESQESVHEEALFLKET